MMKRRKVHYEPDADRAAEEYLGVTIRYAAHSPYGEDLQYLDGEDLQVFLHNIQLLGSRNAW